MFSICWENKEQLKWFPQSSIWFSIFLSTFVYITFVQLSRIDGIPLYNVTFTKLFQSGPCPDEGRFQIDFKEIEFFFTISVNIFTAIYFF